MILHICTPWPHSSTEFQSGIPQAWLCPCHFHTWFYGKELGLNISLLLWHWNTDLFQIPSTFPSLQKVLLFSFPLVIFWALRFFVSFVFSNSNNVWMHHAHHETAFITFTSLYFFLIEGTELFSRALHFYDFCIFIFTIYIYIFILNVFYIYTMTFSFLYINHDFCIFIYKHVLWLLESRRISMHPY